MTEMASQARVEEELQRILRASGIESSPMDPSSMDFLRQLVQDRSSSQTKKISMQHHHHQDDSDYQEEGNSMSAAATSPPGTIVAAGTNRNGAGTPTLSNADAAMILEQLKMQTNLILSLQDKVQVLANKVDQLDNGSRIASTSSNNIMQEEPHSEQQQQQQQRQEDFARAGRLRIFRREIHVIPPPPGLQEVANNAQQQAAPRAAPAVEAAAAAAGPQEELPPGVLLWFFRTTRLFWELSRDYVRPIDGALLFKLVFMTMVVMARFSKNSSRYTKNSKNGKKDPKILMVSAVLMMGFLFHTRYIQYVYQFLWKQNVPYRVWKGEHDITIPPPDQDDHNRDNNNNNEAPRQRNPVPPRLRRPNDPQQDGNNNDRGAAAHWWHRNDLLVGGVAPLRDVEGNPVAPVNPIVAVFQGIFYLVGSFVFSIFPMWNPQGHQQRRPLRQERLDGAAGAQDEGGIPQVQAPRDAMEAADDDDDDDSM